MHGMEKEDYGYFNTTHLFIRLDKTILVFPRCCGPDKPSICTLLVHSVARSG